MYRWTPRDYVFHAVNYAVLLGFALICAYPFYYLLIATLSTPNAVDRGLVVLYPVNFTLDNYASIVRITGISSAFFISLARTCIGTTLTVLLSAMFAYTLTKRELPIRRTLYRISVVSMYVSAGLIPWFLVMRAYGLQNNFLLYILPTAVSPFFLVLIKVYIEQIPPELEESALIDGAGYWTIFWRIILPLCVPVLAAVAVFSAVAQWNTWFDNMILVSNPNLQTLQYVLWTYLSQSEQLVMAVTRDLTAMNRVRDLQVTPTSIRMTITMVVTLPIIFVYPFVQRFFVKGIMLGAIKG